ncbi:MFS transporter [Nonomuraea sp. NPDC000554]|uniref:MFS transporter n=1 Tax=Nonomuraea sp. NPDC000554 TaxID=3154259 RepID=UPI0033242D6D
MTAPRPETTGGYQRIRDRRLISWLAGEFVSHFGDQFFYVAVSVMAAKAGGAGALAVIISVGMLPRLVLMLPGGALVDRLDPRRVMIWSDAVRVGLAAGIALYAALGRPSVPVLLGFMLLFSVVGSVFDPASNAIPVYAVRTEDLSRLQGIRTMLLRISIIAGAPAGGLVVGLGGAPLAFGFDAVSFAFGAVAVAALRTRKPPAPPAPAVHAVGGGEAGSIENAADGGDTGNIGNAAVGGDAASAADGVGKAKAGILRETVEGLRYTARTPLLLAVVLVLAGAEFAVTGPVSVGIPVLALERGWGPPGYGLVLGCFGAGALVGPLTISFVGGRLGRIGTPALVATAIGCLFLAVVAVTPALAVACVAAACMGLAVNFLSAVLIPMLQINADPAYLGRVMSTLSFGFTGLVPVSTALTGVLIAAWGISATITAGAATAALVALAGLTSRQLRHATIIGSGQTKGAPVAERLPTEPQEG